MSFTIKHQKPMKLIMTILEMLKEDSISLSHFRLIFLFLMTEISYILVLYG